MEYKGEFKVIDTKEKAYVLGLIMADGNIFYNVKSGAYQVKIKLQQADYDLLYKIHVLFPFFIEPRLEKRKDGNDSYYIYKYSKEFFEDLQNLGILQRKSFENADKVFMPYLEDDFFFSYVLGLFDGDGSIFQDSKARIRIDLVGKTELLFREISKRLKAFGIENRVQYRLDRDYHMIRISRKEHVKKLIEKFQNNTLCLDRKFKPYFNIDWTLIPGFDNRDKKYNRLFVTYKQLTGPPVK